MEARRPHAFTDMLHGLRENGNYTLRAFTYRPSFLVSLDTGDFYSHVSVIVWSRAGPPCRRLAPDVQVCPRLCLEALHTLLLAGGLLSSGLPVI